jgi:hypothetical protein
MSKLVEFSDGTFGLRKGCWLFGYKFQDFYIICHSRKIRSIYFNDCKTTKEKALSFQNNLNYKVVKK